MRKLLALVLLAFLAFSGPVSADYYGWTATPTEPAFSSRSLATITTVTASTTQLTSLDPYLNGRKEVWVYPNKTVYINGTVATYSLGIPIYTGVNPFIFKSDVPYKNPGISIIASDTSSSLKLLPIR